MMKIAVIGHSGKTLGGGLGELREVLNAKGFPDPLWFEMAKSKQAGKCAAQAMSQGADLIFVWGGDGTVQQVIDAVADSKTAIAILPAGTANLLATNLLVPIDLKEAVEVGLTGERRALDTGTINGEHFAVMAGAGFDALMIRDADGGLKDRIGRAAYVWTAARSMKARPMRATVEVDGRRFFKGKVSCILVGNVSKVLGGIEAFTGSRPDDGILELGVVTAKSRVQWARALGQVAFGQSENSPFVQTTRGTSFKIDFAGKFGYEVDGGVRLATKHLRVKVHPGSVTVCVPAPAKPDSAPVEP